MRTIKNFGVIACLILLVLILTAQISGIFMMIAINGIFSVTIDTILSSNPIIYFGAYWKWYLSNFFILNLSAHNYVVAKILAATAIPFGTLAMLAFMFRAPIMDFRPFKKKESIHGDARWASEKDIKKAGLRSKQGMMIGMDSKGYLIAGGYQHALLFAPTGSGKGVGFVIPNLLYWDDSVVVHDIKLENYELTSGFRTKMGQKVYLWNPASPDGLSHCYNPIDWVSKKPGQMVDDVQKIASLILPEQEFWQNEARSLFVGVVLYLIAADDKIKSFGEVVRTLRSDDVVYNLAVVLDTIGKLIHPVSYMNIAAFLQKADKERSGVISTLNSALELWANPIIDTATASSDFDVQTFKKVKHTIYVGLTPDNIARLKPLMQVFYQQSTEFLSRKMPSKDEPYGVMFMMDEFPTLGKMEQFLTGIAYFRGFHVRLFLIVQDTQQLKGTYEEAGMNSFLSNSTYRITFAANNVETANLISQLIGNKTVDQESFNKPKFFDLNPASRSLHVSQASRALLLPQEVIGLPRDEQIILIESTPPIKTKKIKYYADPFFKKRLLKQSYVPTQEPYDPRTAQAVTTAPAAEEPPSPPSPPPTDYAEAAYHEDNFDQEYQQAARYNPAAPVANYEAIEDHHLDNTEEPHPLDGLDPNNPGGYYTDNSLPDIAADIDEEQHPLDGLDPNNPGGYYTDNSLPDIAADINEEPHPLDGLDPNIFKKPEDGQA